ncbi:MAG: phosphotransferase family protein [Ardenticatenaceae bacterium]
MRGSKEEQRFERLVQRIAPQSQLRRMWRLKGGISAQMTAFEVVGADGQSQKMIRRSRLRRDRSVKQIRDATVKEFNTLQLVQSIGVVTPTPYYLDLSGDLFPTPYLVMEYIEGQPEYAPANISPDSAFQIATQLAKIHSVDSSTLDLSFLPQPTETLADRVAERAAKLADSSDERHIRETLDAVWPLSTGNQVLPSDACLLHGDFWPGNMLWKNGQLVAVVDWEDAKVGDPLEDLAISRFDLLFIFGLDVMKAFTHHYKAISPIDFTHLPYWDLYAALRAAPGIAEWAAGWPQLGRPDLTEHAIREAHRWFITQALEKLPAQGLC